MQAMSWSARTGRVLGTSVLAAAVILAVLTGCRANQTDGTPSSDAAGDGGVAGDIGGLDFSVGRTDTSGDVADGPPDTDPPDTDPADTVPADAGDGRADVADVAADALADTQADTPEPSDASDGTDAASDGAGADALGDVAPPDVAPSDIAPPDVAPSDVAPGDVPEGDIGGDTADGGGSAGDEVTDCLRTLPEPPSGTCAVLGGGAAVLLQGDVLAPGMVYLAGEVLVRSDGVIACVGCDCSGRPEAAGATVVTCPGAVVSPGLIDAHDHLTFTQNAPGNWGTERYEHRHDWRKGLNGHTKISVSGGASWQKVSWGELRHVMAGATAVAGSGDAAGFLRNVDRAVARREGITADVDYETFPLGDSGGTQIASGCGYPDVPSASVLSSDCYLPHVAEGINGYARNEFVCLSSDANGGVDITEPNAAFIHGVGLKAIDGRELAANGTAVIWSPRSNVSLYGDTAPVTMYHTQGVLIGLGTDWTASGSMNIQRELACVAYLNDVHYGGFFSDRDIWEMATVNNAVALAIDDHVGALVAGLEADIAIFRDDPSDGLAETPYGVVLEANVDDTALVLRGGEPLYGDTSVVSALPGGTTGCESIPGGVCGVPKTVCAQRETGASFSELQGANSGAYDLFFCGTPRNEPTCVPSRRGQYDGPTANDLDGDGVANGADNCPTIFNPIRPLDGYPSPSATQGDHDRDGLGDVCDPCPVDADTEDCAPPDPNDQDADGHANVADNCPRDYNPDQGDRDQDGAGDVCDACPDSPNAGGTACPATIYDVKLSVLPDGTDVTVTGVVTAVAAPRFFLQVPEDEVDAELGAAYSGVYVYVPTGNPQGVPVPAMGDLVRLSATISNYYGQIQLLSPPTVEILASDVPLPPPVATTPAAVGTGGVDANAYEAVLVNVVGEVTALDPLAGPGDADPTNEFVLDGALRVNDFIWRTEPAPQVGDVTDVTGVLRWANEDSKVEPRGPEDVVWLVAAPPRLVDFGPSPVYVDEGATGVVSLPELRVLLDRPAPAGGVSIALNSTDPAVGVARGVSIPEGERSAVVRLDGNSATDGPVDVRATLDDRMLTAAVIVVAAGRVPAPVALAPIDLQILLGMEGTLTVTLDIPARAGGTTVALESDDEDVATVPTTVIVAEGAFTATFSVSAATVGDALISASTSGGRAEALIVVSDLPAVGLVLSEVLYDVAGEDTGYEWVEIYNGTGSEVDLSGYSLGAGGAAYTTTRFPLSGSIPAGACWVVGGPQSTATNVLPVFDLAADFNPDIQNSGTTADGVALFAVPAGQITDATVPVDAVVYGTQNDNGLLDATGRASAPNVGDADRGRSIERTADGWRIQPAPTPNDCSAIAATGR